IAVLRGTDPRFGEQQDRPAQGIVLAAPLDSLSEVPVLSPGARDAGNCAALLQAAEYLKNHRPKRDVVLCFFDAQAQNHMGARAFYGALYRIKGNRQLAPLGSLEDRLERFEKEQRHLQYLSDILDKLAPLCELYNSWAKLDTGRNDLLEEKSDLEKHMKKLSDEVEELEKESPGKADRLAELARPLALTERRLKELPGEIAALDEQMADCERRIDAPEMASRKLFSDNMRNMPRHSLATYFLRTEATGFDSQVLEKLSPMRIQFRRLKNDLKEARKEKHKLEHDGKDLSEVEQTIWNLQSRIDSMTDEVDVLVKRDLSWNGAIRDIYKGRITAESRGRFALLVQEAKKVIARRGGELDQWVKQTNQSRTIRDALGEQRDNIVLHVSLNLGDARDKWTFVHGDDTVPFNIKTQDLAGNYKAIFHAMREVWKSNPGKFGNFDDRAISGTYESRTRLFAPGMFVDSGAIPRILALYNVAVMTSMDRLPRQGQPADTLAALDTQTFYRQLKTTLPFLKLLADHPGLNVAPKIRSEARFDESSWSGDKSIGPSVKQAGAGSAMADKPVRDAIVAVIRKPIEGPWNGGTFEFVPPGFCFPILTKTDTHGIFEIGPYCADKTQDYYNKPVLFAALFDRTPIGTGEIAESYSTRGIITSVTNAETLETTLEANLEKAAVNLFKARVKTLVGYEFERGALLSTAMRAGSTSKFHPRRHLLCEIENVSTLYAPYISKGIKLFNKAGLVALNNAPTKDEYEGKGISLEDQFQHPATTSLNAHDLGVLNSYRLEILRDSRIKQESLEILNGEAQDLQKDAKAQRIAGEGEVALSTSLSRYIGDQGASAALSRRAYIPLVTVMNDLITAVVLLLLLAMPFAYSLERLLIGTPHIFRQIAWFALFFALTFGVLYFVNPAFKIAATPMIIFLAFAIILLSSLVIFIMVRKLQTEIKKIQGLAATVHSADVSRLSTMMAAVQMGISTMRRRPIRTLLTGVTVLLLTFTILTFASFGSSWGIRKKYEGPMVGSPARIIVRHQLWGPMGKGIFETLRGHLSDRAKVVPRYWISSTAKQAEEQTETELLLSTNDLERITPLAAAVGLDLRDVQMQPHFEELFFEKGGDGDTKRPLADMEMLESNGIILTT
ncbi:MAG: M28 family peptidase, partial [Planctomycetota bacterium]